MCLGHLSRERSTFLTRCAIPPAQAVCAQVSPRTLYTSALSLSPTLNRPHLASLPKPIDSSHRPLTMRARCVFSQTPRRAQLPPGADCPQAEIPRQRPALERACLTLRVTPDTPTYRRSMQPMVIRRQLAPILQEAVGQMRIWQPASIMHRVAPRIRIRSVPAQVLDGHPPPSVPPTEDTARNRSGRLEA